MPVPERVYGGRYFLPLNRQNRETAGVAAGERITVELEAGAHRLRVALVLPP